MTGLRVVTILALAALAGCGSVARDPLASAYLAAAHCYSYDYARTSTTGCNTRMWH